MKDYRSYSFWLETAGDDLTPRSPLAGSEVADVAILGAGFTGLWTAYYLLRRRPALRVVLLEREIAGFGASGRNGGWCTSGFSVTPGMLARRFGREAARNLQQAMWATVDEVGRVCVEQSIDAQYYQGGGLRIARGRHQLPAIDAAYATYRELGLEDRYQVLDRATTDARVRVSEAQGSQLTADCASIHPGRLVRGLARVVELYAAGV